MPEHFQVDLVLVKQLFERAAYQGRAVRAVSIMPFVGLFVVSPVVRHLPPVGRAVHGPVGQRYDPWSLLPVHSREVFF